MKRRPVSPTPVGNRSNDRKRSSTIGVSRLLIEEPKVRELLTRIVIRMDGNPHSREDLMQEALVHLWIEECHHPGHRLSWYLQGVKFHLHHRIVSGRSLDSPKHRKAQAVFPDNCDGQDQWPDTLECD